MEQVKNVPALRFLGFDGEWNKTILRDVVDIKSAKYNPSKVNTSVKCIELEHISSETSQLLGYVNGRNLGSIKNVFNKEDVLFGKLRPYLKKYLIAPFDGVCSSEIWVLKSNLGVNVFLFYLVQTDAFIDLANISTGSKMPRADWNVVSAGAFRFPPSLPEQQKIAAFLTAVDDKIHQLSKKKTLLEQYKKGLMQRIFSQQIRFKPDRTSDGDDQGNDYPEWEVKTLRDVGEMVGGGTPETYIEKYWGGTIQWFTPTELKKKYVLQSTRQITKDGLANSSAKLLPTGAILLSSRATVGDVSIALGECCTNQGFQSIIANDHNVNEFIYYWLLLNKHLLLKKASGSTFLEINKTEISKLKIALPHYSEQTKIANFLSAIDDKINHVTRQITHTRQYKKGLLQQMFV